MTNTRGLARPITADRSLGVVKRYPCIVYALNLLKFQQKRRKHPPRPAPPESPGDGVSMHFVCGLEN